MLVLARKVGQSVILHAGPHVVRLMVTEIQIGGNVLPGGTIRLGIDAPREIRILREELLSPQGEIAHTSGECEAPA